MADVNGFDPVPLSVDGGRVNSELIRLGLYASTSGAEGIVSAGDCKVHQLTTPGTQVAIDSGALLILNRSANVDNQTYAANARVESRLDIPATGAGGRSDLIIVRVEDEQYSPWPVPDAGARPTWPRVKPIRIANVPNTTTDVAQLNLGYSAYAIARVDIPASTSVITNQMIKDLREMAIPRQRYRVFSLNPMGAGQEQNAPNDGSFMRVGNYSPLVPTPKWATHATVLATISGLAYIDGVIVGDMRVSFGNSGSSVFGPWIQFDTPGPGPDRITFTAAGELNVQAYRGLENTQVGVDLRRNQTFSVGRLAVVQQTNVTLQITFEERAV